MIYRLDLLEKSDFSSSPSISLRLTFVCMYSYILCPGRAPLTWHANAAKSTRIIETAALVLAWMGLTLVHVGLAPGSCEPLGTVASERSGRVDTDTVVFAG